MSKQFIEYSVLRRYNFGKKTILTTKCMDAKEKIFMNITFVVNTSEFFMQD